MNVLFYLSVPATAAAVEGVLVPHTESLAAQRALSPRSKHRRPVGRRTLLRAIRALRNTPLNRLVDRRGDILGGLVHVDYYSTHTE